MLMGVSVRFVWHGCMDRHYARLFLEAVRKAGCAVVAVSQNRMGRHVLDDSGQTVLWKFMPLARVRPLRKKDNQRRRTA